MKIAIFFLLTLAADGSDFKCDKGKEPVQKKNLVIDTTVCSDTGKGKAFHDEYTQGAEKCCDLKYACLQICGIDKKQCKKFGSLKEKSIDCDAFSRCKNEQQDKKTKCEEDFEDLVDKVQENFRKQPCTCAKDSKVNKRREKVLNDFAEKNDVPDCLKNVNYSNNTEVAEWFLKIIKKEVIGTNVCADHEKMSVMTVELDSNSSTALAYQ